MAFPWLDGMLVPKFPTLSPPQLSESLLKISCQFAFGIAGPAAIEQPLRKGAARRPDAGVFSESAKAIGNKEAVEFGYRKLDTKTFEKRTVEPWHLACVSGQWYLLGYDRNRKGAPDLRARPHAEGLATWPQVFQFTAGGSGDSTALPEQFSNLAKRKRRARANRLKILRPGRAARSRTELAFEPADPRVSRRSPRTVFNSEFAGRDNPLGPFLGKRL
jgi:WYL domain-containing protein